MFVCLSEHSEEYAMYILRILVSILVRACCAFVRGRGCTDEVDADNTKAKSQQSCISMLNTSMSNVINCICMSKRTQQSAKVSAAARSRGGHAWLALGWKTGNT